ncbi:MAG: phenylacetate-CoA oxygenase subunit PaaJ [Burkholderiaceae bacterium]|jgi:ring-1,2-phenylacetyl-CoA epoxidase subunit PaaD|nr:phenylacetate-CoA oxygenase subunit PaaJ [Burkholderiaceae bacterium]
MAPVATLSIDAAWTAVGAVPDPEIPVISVVELGIVRDVRVAGDGSVDVTVTPTYSGCPATELIERDIVAALERAGAPAVRVLTQLAPAWTTEWIDPAARAKLRAYGIVPPAEHATNGVRPLHFVPRALACPRCGSEDTERLSQFGATACKALYRCRACAEPFEYFKPL